MKSSSHVLDDGHFEALDQAKELDSSPRDLDRLAKSVGQDLARWAIGQWALRRRAQAKFALAEKMLFDRDGLEMASHENVARFHAALFPPGELVADLTCGIGADLIALANRGPAIGLEIDPLRAAMARHNLLVHGHEAEVLESDSLSAPWTWDYAFADPSRRSEGRRHSDPASFLPNPDTIAQRFRSLELGVIKLSPLLQDAYLDSLGGEREFISFQGECREVVVRLGRQESHGGRNVRAVLVEGGALEGESDPGESVAEPGPILFEADPSAIRAHALGDLGGKLRAAPLGDSNGYLTSNLEPPEWVRMPLEWVRAYRVHASGRADPKRIREDLRRLDAQVSAVKTRGVQEDPRAWMAKLKSSGSLRMALVLYPVGKSVRYALVEPI